MRSRHLVLIAPFQCNMVVSTLPIMLHLFLCLNHIVTFLKKRFCLWSLCSIIRAPALYDLRCSSNTVLATCWAQFCLCEVWCLIRIETTYKLTLFKLFKVLQSIMQWNRRVCAFFFFVFFSQVNYILVCKNDIRVSNGMKLCLIKMYILEEREKQLIASPSVK